MAALILIAAMVALPVTVAIVVRIYSGTAREPIELPLRKR